MNSVAHARRPRASTRCTASESPPPALSLDQHANIPPAPSGTASMRWGNARALSELTRLPTAGSFDHAANAAHGHASSASTSSHLVVRITHLTRTIRFTNRRPSASSRAK
ncbi:MAG: hypothetical protein IPJ04_18015 [Candidatus Eisenbacteria bacterium]|nr:hypothetical protein [Candidatus Eisenbacteria bacterium]